jgi:hypothetical protein
VKRGQDPFGGVRKRVLTPFLLACAAQALAQGEEARTLEVDSGRMLAYTLRVPEADAHLAEPPQASEAASALGTAILVIRHLSAGRIEDAALLSNAPRRRYEVLRDYRDSVGEEEFKRVFGGYFAPGNRLLAEISIGAHKLLVWKLAREARLAGQYFVEVDGRWLVDDVPNATRASLRSILEAYRSGKLR